MWSADADGGQRNTKDSEGTRRNMIVAKPADGCRIYLKRKRRSISIVPASTSAGRGFQE